MEKLILFLIVFGVGSFFEYLKKKREQRADSVVDKIFGAGQASETAVQAEARKPKRKPKKTARKPPLPVSCVQPSADAGSSSLSQQPPVLPDEGGSIFDTPIDEDGTEQTVFAPSGKQEQDLSEHYQRWRRAIIDSEILQRKF